MRMLAIVLALVVGAFATSGVTTSALAGDNNTARIYKSRYCGCCEGYTAYLRQNGFEVEVTNSEEMGEIKRLAGVPEPMESCHTMLIGNYVVEGHVPLRAITKLLREKPAIRGIALPGMEQGSPGMDGEKTEPFTIYAITDDGTPVFMID